MSDGPLRCAMPRRPTDRIEDAVAWLLTALGLLVAVAAVVTAVHVYGAEMARARTESAERTGVQALLLELAPPRVVPGGTAPGLVAGPVAVAARYTSADGVEHDVEIWVAGPQPAGSSVPVWVDRYGTLVPAPTRGADALWAAVVAGASTWFFPTVVLLGMWELVQVGLRRANMARWERGWTRVEPEWSGRAR